MMQLLDEQGRALAHALLRAPQVIEEIAAEAGGDEVALAELTAVAWLFAKLALELELHLATTRATAAEPPSRESEAFADEDVIAETRFHLGPHSPAVHA
ncbi:MAG: hypothetical protein ACRD2H_05120 [Terriglobales bacterium]